MISVKDMVFDVEYHVSLRVFEGFFSGGMILKNRKCGLTNRDKVFSHSSDFS